MDFSSSSVKKYVYFNYCDADLCTPEPRVNCSVYRARLHTFVSSRFMQTHTEVPDVIHPQITLTENSVSQQVSLRVHRRTTESRKEVQ